MTASLTHVSASIPAAVRALRAPPSLEQQCADVDHTNPHALEHWTHRVRAMRRFPGADEALRYLLFEIASRRTDVQAHAKSFNDAIRHPGAWLNRQSLTWLARRKCAPTPERNLK